MTIYKAPVEESLFLLNDVFHIDRYANLPVFADVSPDIVEATLAEAAKLCEQVIAPLNRIGDEQGCTRHVDGSVTTPKGFKEAFQQLTDGGWVGISCPAEYGGQELPGVIGNVVSEFLGSANLSFWMYDGLTQGAIDALIHHGSAEQKSTYLPNMVAGKWTGTMNLTEAHCGTDLGMLRTKAVKQADGAYRITGSKIFTSSGEHDLAENIIHLVLARIEGAPAGVKGISLFVIPKFIVNPDGALGARNQVSCGSIEHKMGIHGNSTCVMNFDGAAGWLVGEENRGLNALFTMMNHSRLGVGIHALGISEVAYQNAAAYAKERLQGRSLTGPKFPDKPADPIIVHPDVRRSLLTIRALTESARALIVWTGLKHDIAEYSDDESARQQAEDHLALMTPIIKGFGSDCGFNNAVMAQQMYGGHGYIADNGMEQFVRDARINQIYEGANGVQAMDLVGRKLGLNGGRPVMAFFAEVEGYLTEIAKDGALSAYATPMQKALGHLQRATAWFAQHGAANHDDPGAGAYDYMHLFGLVAQGYMWCRMVEAALTKLPTAAGEEAERLNAKLITGRFYMERLLPETATRLARIEAGSESTMALAAEAF
jgi:alkylation response protein AidB-like acyl-CoA dehydrogenase